MEDSLYVIDHLIVMGLDLEKDENINFEKIRKGNYPIDFLDIYPLKTPGSIPSYLARYEEVGSK